MPLVEPRAGSFRPEPGALKTQRELEQIFRGEAPMPSAGGQIEPATPLDRGRTGRGPAFQSAPSAETAASAPPPGGTSTPALSTAGIESWYPGWKAPDTAVAPYSPNQESYGSYLNLFGPATETIGKATEALGGAEAGFKAGAGPSRSFGDLGGEDFLSGLKGSLSSEGAPREKAISEAKGLAQSQYGGPTGLSTEALSNISSLLVPLEGLNPTRGEGLTYLLQGQHPGLTAGEYQHEAERTLQDPAFSKAAEQYLQDIGGITSAVQRELGEAQTYSQARAKEEEDIASQTKKYFTGAGEDILGQLDIGVEEKKAVQKEISDAYQKFFESGDLKDLQALQEAQPEAMGFDLKQFGTPIRYFEHAKEAYQGVVGKGRYKAIRDMPLLQLGISRHGWPVFQIDQKWLDSHKNLTPQQLTRLATLAYQRQEDLLTGGFNTFGKEINQMVPIVKMQYGGKDIEMPMGGQRGDVKGGSSTYAPVVPTMLGQTGFAPKNPASYIEPQNFTAQPTRGNIASGEQRQILDAIGQILSQPETYGLSDATPFQAAQLAVDMEKWLADNEKLKNSIKGQMTKNEAQYFQDVHEHRKRFGKLRAKKKWGHITDIMAGIYTFGGTEILRNTPVGSATQIVPNVLSEGAYSLFK